MAGKGHSHEYDEGLNEPDDSISFHNVKAFMLQHDGKVKHSELVNFFRRLLTDPCMKGMYVESCFIGFRKPNM